MPDRSARTRTCVGLSTIMSISVLPSPRPLSGSLLVRRLLGEPSVRVLTYHRVGRAPRDPFCVAPSVFDEQMAALELPLADPSVSPKHVPADYYYRIPVRPIYKSYPVYAPGKEPQGYREWLKKQQPETVFDVSRLKT